MSARFTLIVVSRWYTPGVKIRFWPRARALLIACASSEGLAMKKSSIGIDEPGVEPPSQSAPAELCSAAGTKTL